MSATAGPHYQVRALERALDILNVFSINEPELTLTDIAARAEVAKSTTFRLLTILEERGYVERSTESDRYRIGIRAFEVGSIYIQTTRVEVEAQPFLHILARECNQTANLGVLDRGAIVHLSVVPPDRPIRYFATIGQRDDAHCTGLGKALLADMSDRDLKAFVEQHGLPRRTANTSVTFDQLQSALARVRARGVAIDEEETEIGLTCVAAPIRDATGQIVAAASISGPAAEFRELTLPRYIDAVRRTAETISDRLGHAVRPSLVAAR